MPEPHAPKRVQPNPAVAYRVVFEDAHLLVIDKPPGLVVQPGKGHTSDTLLNGLFSKYGPRLGNLGPSRDFGLLHRLDRETSGLLVVAMDARAYDALRRDFAGRRIDKRYLALLAGTLPRKSGRIEARLKEAVVQDRKKVIVSSAGEEAISTYRVVAQGPAAALVQVTIETGRLHQIRAHMAFLGHPVLGDDMYGQGAGMRSRPPAPRLALHAAHLSFMHPLEQQRRTFDLPLPDDLAQFAQRLGLPVHASPHGQQPSTGLHCA